MATHQNVPDPRPALPRLVLGMGFAGSRNLPEDARRRLSGALVSVLGTVAQRLAEIAPGTPGNEGQAPRIARFYARHPPLLRLITGLAEGADALAAEALEQAKVDNAGKPRVDGELAAVLPFDLKAYRAGREATFRAEFDRLAGRCASIVVIDGRFEKPPGDTSIARKRRARAYRGQSALLLRQSDLLVAAANPDDPVKAGGTLETVRAALEFELAVVFVHTGTGGVWLIEPGQDFASILAEEAPPPSKWQNTLRDWITDLVAASNAALERETKPNGARGHGHTLSYGERLLKEFFEAADVPPTATARDGTPGRKKTFRERRWNGFEKRFRPAGISEPESDRPLEPYAGWRSRATRLNYHYSGLYRGAFVLNYTLAVWAVLLATLSLVLLSVARGAVWLAPVLAILGAGKLAIVVWIYRNTHQANLGEWNDKAVDYRYLAERLRAMFYLPQIGSFRPPAVAMPQYGSRRVVPQSAVDWLFDAITRDVSPARFTVRESILGEDDRPRGQANVFRPDALTLLQGVRDRWVYQQSVYHDRNARTMDRMYKAVRGLGSVLSMAVIGFVAADLLLLLVEWSGALPEAWEHAAASFTPWLIFLAALLPAVVASLNAVRFQSECRRLAERSAVMRAILRGHEEREGKKGGRWAEADQLAKRIGSQPSSTNLHAWVPEVLRLTETIATDFAREVAEWSVVYAKEVPEP
jgi:hypothetical protein